jgi:hypothetical protein
VKPTTARATGALIFAAALAYISEALVRSHRVGSLRLTPGDYFVPYVVPNLPPPKELSNLWLTLIVAFLIDLVCWFLISFGLLTLARRIPGSSETK